MALVDFLQSAQRQYYIKECKKNAANGATSPIHVGTASSSGAVSLSGTQVVSIDSAKAGETSDTVSLNKNVIQQMDTAEYNKVIKEIARTDKNDAERQYDAINDKINKLTEELMKLDKKSKNGETLSEDETKKLNKTINEQIGALEAIKTAYQQIKNIEIGRSGQTPEEKKAALNTAFDKIQNANADGSPIKDLNLKFDKMQVVAEKVKTEKEKACDNSAIALNTQLYNEIIKKDGRPNDALLKQIRNLHDVLKKELDELSKKSNGNVDDPRTVIDNATDEQKTRFDQLSTQVPKLENMIKEEKKNRANEQQLIARFYINKKIPAVGGHDADSRESLEELVKILGQYKGKDVNYTTKDGNSETIVAENVQAALDKAKEMLQTGCFDMQESNWKKVHTALKTNTDKDLQKALKNCNDADIIRLVREYKAGIAVNNAHWCTSDKNLIEQLYNYTNDDISIGYLAGRLAKIKKQAGKELNGKEQAALEHINDDTENFGNQNFTQESFAEYVNKFANDMGIR